MNAALMEKNTETLVRRSRLGVQRVVFCSFPAQQTENTVCECWHKPFVLWCIKVSTLNTNCFFSAQEAGVFWYFTGSLSITAISHCNQAKWRPPIQPSPENRPNNPGNTCFCVLYMHLQCAGQRWSFFDLYAHCEMRAANVVALSHWEEEEK